MTAIKRPQNTDEAGGAKPDPDAQGDLKLGALHLSIDQQSVADSTDTASTAVENPADVSLSLHPVPSQNALIVKIQAPRAPSPEIHHVPCDIVLVIDVSGSMQTLAPVPGEGDGESTGLTVLDLVKHTALAIIETLGDNDRLGIVTFSTNAKVEQTIKAMTPQNKEAARRTVKGLQTQDATNLWGGISTGLKLFADEPAVSNVPSLLVLTDGMPNHMCPPQGYEYKLHQMMPLPASIHTFGFGYTLRSGLLKSIAEIGGGNYAFIPDAGMVGTVFVHATANLQATFATEVDLQLSYTKPLDLESTMGEGAYRQVVKEVEREENGKIRITVAVGSLQYGQSRDIFWKVKGLPDGTDLQSLGGKDGPQIRAVLRFKRIDPQPPRSPRVLSSIFRGPKPKPVAPSLSVVSVSCNMLGASGLSDSEIAYHDSRARICKFLNSLKALERGSRYPRDGAPDMTAPIRDELATLIADIPAQNFPDDQNQSLMKDLTGDEPHGQISLALSSAPYYHRWGLHYVRSYAHAHTRQTCNSFKDPGPLQYGLHSPLFAACRDRLNDAFDSLPPPAPSAATRFSAPMPTSMRIYNSANTPCFAGSAKVRLASGREVAVRRLRRGVKVQTPVGARKVAAVLKTPVAGAVVCPVGELLVTPWHPVSEDGTVWKFPAHMAKQSVRYTGAVYSVMLQRDSNSDAHAISVGGLWGVTLGHGIKAGADVRAHEFLGDYALVGKSLARIGSAKNGVFVGGGLARDEKTGRVSGFRVSMRGSRV